MRIRTFFERHAMGLATAFLLLADFILQSPKRLSGWAPTWYALDYSIGTGSRLLVGSVLRLLKGDFVTTASAEKFISAGCLVLILLFALLMDAFYRSSAAETKRPAGLMILLCASAPFAPRYLWNEANFGRLDLYLCILLVLSLFVCLRIKRPWLRAAVATLASIAALFVHQIYFFIFFPAILALLLTDAFRGDRVTIKRLLPAASAAVLVAAVFLYVQLCSNIRAATADELMAALSKTSDLDVSHSALDYEYFHDFMYGFENHMKPFLENRTVFASLALTLVLMSPAVLLYGCLFRGMFASLKRRGIPAFCAPQPYLLMLLICYLAPFVLAVDWNRWLGALFLSFGLILLTLLAVGDGAAKDAFSALSRAMERRPVLFLLLLLYFAMLSPFRAREFLPEVQALVTLAGSIL